MYPTNATRGPIRRRARHLFLPLLAAPLLLGASPARHGEGGHEPFSGEPGAPHSMGGMGGHDMERMHGEMQRRMQSMAERLSGLVDRMNAASGGEKTEAVAAVVGELASQWSEMTRMMMGMQPRMMRHAMMHLQQGMMAGMKESMSMCPMMGGDDAGKPDAGEQGDSHEAHHRK